MIQQCIFCQIVSKKMPTKIVYEDDGFIAFLDINPINPGHTLVIPKEHSETILDVNPETLSKLAKVVKIVAEAVAKALNVDGVNVMQNNKEIAGQGVPHIHFHVIPRFNEDGVQYFFGSQTKKMDEKQLEEIANKIKSNVKIPEPEIVEEKEEEESVEHTEEEANNIRRELGLA